MRVAVLVNGHPRSFDAIAGAHNSWLQGVRGIASLVDVFVHCWDGGPDPVWADAMLARLNARWCAIEEPPALTSDVLFEPGLAPESGARGRAASFALMWASMARTYAAVQEVEATDGRYDWVVRVRPDTLWDVPSELLAAIASGRPHLPRRLASRRTPSDLAAVLPRAVAGTYFSTFPEIPALRQSYEREGYRSFTAEFALDHHLRQAGFAWDQFTSDVALVRSQQTWLWFPQDPWYFASTASWALVDPTGDNIPGNPVPDLLARSAVSLVENGNIAPDAAVALAPAISAVAAADTGDALTSLPCLMSTPLSGTLAAPSTQDVLVGAAIARGFQQLPRPSAARLALARPRDASRWAWVAARVLARRLRSQSRQRRAWTSFREGPP